MVFDFTKDSRTVIVTMPKYVKKVLDEYPHSYKSTEAHDKDLFKINNSPASSKDEQQLFHSTVMRIVFYASRV